MTTLFEITEALSHIRDSVAKLSADLPNTFTVPLEVTIREITIPMLDTTMVGDKVRTYTPGTVFIVSRIMEETPNK